MGFKVYLLRCRKLSVVKQMFLILQVKGMIPFKAFQILGYEPCMQIIIEKNKNNKF